MTEQEWLACEDDVEMVHHLGRTASKRKARLYAATCCRRAWEALPVGPCRRAVEVGERLADGRVGEKQRLAALRALQADDAPPDWNAVWAAECAVARNVPHMLRAHVHTANLVAQHRARGDRDLQSRLWEIDRATYPGLLRCIFGNPFRPAEIAPKVLAWRDGLLVALAQRMYESRDFAEMGVMTDMLEDAGCRDAQVLGHCRGPASHARGCFVVDLLLGKT
jgi:hypothetical protein